MHRIALALIVFSLLTVPPSIVRSQDKIRDLVVRIHVVQHTPDVLRPWTKNSPQQVKGSGVVIEGKRILELGCGHGEFAVWLAKQGASVTGVDVGHDLVRSARLLAEVNEVECNFQQGNLVDLPVNSATYDVVVGLAILHHLSEVDVLKAVREAHRVLKSDGGFAVFHEFHSRDQAGGFQAGVWTGGEFMGSGGFYEDDLVKTADGFLYLNPSAFYADFAADLPREQAEFEGHSQMLTSADVFTTKIADPAWKVKPSWYLVAKADRIINPDLERLYASRAHSHTVEVDGASHAVYESHPKEVAALIEQAAEHAQE